MIERFYVRGQGHNPLSNFSAHPITIRGIDFPTVEHFYQAMKTHDVARAKAIVAATGPKEAKTLGRRVTLRSDWEEIKLDMMRMGLKGKFTHGSEAGRFLLETGNQFLIEGNDWGDTYWGCIMVDGEWRGRNWLGHLLMARRDELRSDWYTERETDMPGGLR